MYVKELSCGADTFYGFPSPFFIFSRLWPQIIILIKVGSISSHLRESGLPFSRNKGRNAGKRADTERLETEPCFIRARRVSYSGWHTWHTHYLFRFYSLQQTSWF